MYPTRGFSCPGDGTRFAGLAAPGFCNFNNSSGYEEVVTAPAAITGPRGPWPPARFSNGMEAIAEVRRLLVQGLSLPLKIQGGSLGLLCCRLQRGGRGASRRFRLNVPHPGFSRAPGMARGSPSWRPRFCHFNNSSGYEEVVTAPAAITGPRGPWPPVRFPNGMEAIAEVRRLLVQGSSLPLTIRGGSSSLLCRRLQHGGGALPEGFG